MMTQMYRSGKELEARGLDIVQDPIWIMLLNENYSFDDKHKSREEIAAFEISGLGYSTGGRPVMGRNIAWNESVLQVKAEDVVWPRATLRSKCAVVYRARGGHESGDQLICFFDFGENVSSMNGPFRIEWPGGVMRES